MRKWFLRSTWGAVLASLVLAAGAAASYSGGAGVIAYQSGGSETLEADNGVVEYGYDINEWGTATTGATGVTGAVGCSGDAGGENGEVQYCPFSVPGFSPDGGHMVFAGVATQADGSVLPAQPLCGSASIAMFPFCIGGVVMAAADGTSPTLVPVPGVARVDAAAFMPSGRSLLLAGATGPTGPDQLFTASVDGSGVKELTTTGASEPAPCPNGAILYVHSGDIYRRAADGAVTRLTTRGGAWPDCSHDSATVAFVNAGVLESVSSNGRHLRRIIGTKSALCPFTSARAAVCVVGRPAFSPAGGAIAVTTESRCTGGYDVCGESGTPRGCVGQTEGIEVVDLLGRRLSSESLGIVGCQPDYGLPDGGLGGVAWQPAPALP